MKSDVQKKYPWFKVKGYPHIGLPLTYADADDVAKYAMNPKKVAHHGFKPLIYRETKVRKYRRALDELGHRLNYRIPGEKSRDLYYANHFDAQIYSYYANELNKRYEDRLKSLAISECATAYRFIPREDEPTKGKSSVHFAKEALEAIKAYPESEFSVLIIDISSFFDSLNHKLLKRKWADIWKSKSVSLEFDHYNLFKSLTNVSFIYEYQIFNKLKSRIWVKRKKGGYRQKKISSKKYLYDNNAVAYCKSSEFEEELLRKGLVNKLKNKDTPKCDMAGIPQGTPISAVLANTYMIDFDYSLYSWLKEKGGYYRRYSDDMFFICKKEDEDKLFEKVEQELVKEKLSFQKSKTQLVQFWRDNNTLRCAVKNNVNESWNPSKNLEYLGFEFDGKRVLVKSASLAKYFRKMKLNVRRGAHFAAYGKIGDTHIYNRPLFKKFSWLGAQRKRKYIRSKKHPKKLIRTHHYDWGNFLTYAKSASQIMEEPAILRQLRRHQLILKNYIRQQQHKADRKRNMLKK